MQDEKSGIISRMVFAIRNYGALCPCMLFVPAGLPKVMREDGAGIR